MFSSRNKILLRLSFLVFFCFFLGCKNAVESESKLKPEDCAGVEGGENVCGCTDILAINYDSTATYDDNSCEMDTLQKILFFRYNSDASANESAENLHIINIKGENERLLTSANIYHDRIPVVTSDGLKIIFPDSIFSMFSIDYDGLNRKKIYNNDVRIRGMDISQNDSLIVFSAGYDIIKMNLDGSNPVTLTSGEFDKFPKFSPDGSSIVFERSHNLGSSIYVMNISGDDLQCITCDQPFRHGGMENKHPNFSPDGNMIVFVSNLYSQVGWANYWLEEIFIRDSNGENEQRLTFSSAQPSGEQERSFPHFSNDGSIIFFGTGGSGNNDDRSTQLIDLNGNLILKIWAYEGSASINQDNTLLTITDSGIIKIIDIIAETSTEIASGQYPIFIPKSE
jgi:dipeptidyl aminopeptidase/acylaminoacyl peptidase